ncbi:glycoside hydrolase family 6 protein [Actinomycetes bacterium KLBMP 9797]
MRRTLMTLVLTAALGAAAPASAAPTGGNPYAGARGYLDPDWSARAAAQAATAGELAPAMSVAARQPTAVWLDSVAAITAGRGLRGHLDAALAQQQAAGQPVVATFVLYDLPARSCRRAPNGDFTAAEAARYKAEFVDPIAAILAEPRYRTLRIAVVVEPDALWQVIPVYSFWRCEEARLGGVYLDTIPYVLAKLHPIPNVSAYLDVAQSNLLGWASNFQPAVELFAAVAARTPGGVASVDGFAVNAADYDPVEEPFLDIGMSAGGHSVRQSRFVDWNDHLEEHTYIDAVYAALRAKGFPPGIGALVDTARNGWGGPRRPVAPSTSPHLDTFVDESKVDGRRYRYTWCNQVGAGLGERPRTAPRAHVHTYAWITPPGESDGHYSGLPEYGREPQCDPNQTMPPIGAHSRMTNAMPGAPPRGEWFPAAFTELVRNAHPPLS